MNTIIGAALFGIFSILSALHVYWGFGGRWGITATLPKKETGDALLNPTAFHCFVVALGLLLFGWVALMKAFVIHSPSLSWLTDYGLWAIAIFFFARAVGDFRYVGFFKKVRTTDFGRMDTRLYSPLCLFISALATILQMFSSPTT